MELRTLVACTVCAVTVALAAVGCADGTGQALIPTLPSIEGAASNPDGTRLKATVPGTLAPRASIRVSSLTPQLSVSNATGEYVPTALSYEFELYEGSTRLAGSGATASTLWTVPANTLKEDKTYAWRARATMGGIPGSWSDSAEFRTPLPPPVDIDGPVSCEGSSGEQIIACVARAYPQYLVPTAVGSGSLARRHYNMEFIRDRIIETGICKGLNLARNFKRGTPVISHDFIVQRTNRDRGVDLASGYDDVNVPLRLTWFVFGAERNYGFPYYAGYPPVDCSRVNQ